MKQKPHFFHKSMIAFLTGAILFTACNKNDKEIIAENDPISNLTTAGDEQVSALAVNLAPHPKTGPDQTTTLPKDSVTLDASGSFDDDGNIVSYLWTKDFGTGSTIASSTSAKTVIKGLSVGAYRYKLTVTDNSGGTATDTIRITVNGNGGSANQSPTVSAGAAQAITLPTNYITLTAVASDPDGNIVSYLWTKVSGPAGVIRSASAVTSRMYNLVAGTYVFNMKVTDNKGAAANSTVSVTVNATAPPNQSPVVTTGSAQTISLPVSTITLTGSATDADGTIASYLWTKVSGAGGNITSPNAASTTVTGLIAGSYVYDLKATDNKGATANATVNVTVNAPAQPNQSPVVTTGSSQTITLPLSTITLTGSATDADGTIASYLWTKVSGIGGNITSPNAASTTVTGLIAGSYVFNLKATDNKGASGNKTVSITVLIALPIPPPPTSYGTLIYSTGFNALSDINNGQVGNGTISTLIFKTGPGSFYSRPANISAGTRSEIQYSESQTPLEGVIEYDVLYEVVVPNNGHSIQFHPNTSGSSAALALWHTDGKFNVTRWYGGDNYHQTGTLMTIQTNKWYAMRLEYKFNNTSGYYRWYIDNVLYYSYSGKVGDGSGQYLKLGYNGWDANSLNSRIYYDNLKIWKK